MPQKRISLAAVMTLCFIVAGAGLALLFTRFIDPTGGAKIATVLPAAASSRPAGVEFNPPKPEDAPPDMRDAVMLGYNIMTKTKQFAPEYVGNSLSCDNCHFRGGATESGKNGGLSLVGVAAKYPMYRDRQKYSVDLVVRVNDCFERSMNGTAPPVDSKEMQALMAYLHWISKDIPIYANVPWLKLSPLDSAHQPDIQAGQREFTATCASCHGTDGQGTLSAPPLIGDMSYNDGAGMASAKTLAAFAFNNMPKGNPTLTPEQALDVAAYVDSMPRPHFIKH